jgi:hypothetical protein
VFSFLLVDIMTEKSTPSSADSFAILATQWPVFAWRFGLGPLLGQAFMLLGIRGPTGEPNYHLAPYFFTNGQKYLYVPVDAPWASAVLATPYITIQTAYGMESVQAVRVTDGEILVTIFAHLMQNRPALAQQLMGGSPIQSLETDLAAAAIENRLPIYGLVPTTQPTPIPIKADLGWVLPAFAVFWWLTRNGKKKPKKD